MDLSTFNNNALQMARQNGLTEEVPFSIVVLGPSENLASVKKRITVGYTSPQKAEGSDPEELWLNVNDGNLYRFGTDWTVVSEYDSVFFKNRNTGTGGSGPFDGNTATGPIYLPANPQNANEAVNKAYVDSLVGGIVAGTSSIKTPTATVASLRSMSMTGIVDKDLIFVEETEKIYAYDAQAVGTDDSGKTMIRPASGIGRWKTTIQGTLDGGSF